jgi:hypothetical protein
MTKGQTLPRKTLRCGLLITVMAVAAMEASAQNVTVRGSGTCQAYLDAKARNSVQDAVKDLTWLLGYMSGLAVATHVNVLGTEDNADLMLKWVDTYCQLYPAKYLSDAGDLYYRFLKERMQAKADGADTEKVRREVR